VKRRAPATERNRDAIAAVLRGVLPPHGLVLEVASGTGEHAAYFARLFPALTWQPSDPDPDALNSIAAWAADADLPNLREPVQLDASGTWPFTQADAVLCINMAHISPWAATLGLLDGAARLLPSGAPLCLYGPYRREGIPTAPSNEAFDRSLRERNPEWGVRNLEDVAAEAERRSLRLDRVVEMPANNLSVVFRRM
jgi:SAM-dependent methyltransferase